MMDNDVRIENFNKFSCPSKVSYHEVSLELKERCHIITNHIFDMTDSIYIGSRTVIAGAGTSFWTHSYYITEEGKEIRIDAPISIGNRCYIGAKSCILSGVDICDNCIIGAMTCVSKSLIREGIYVSCGLRFIEKSKEWIDSLGKPSYSDYIFRKQ